MVHAWSILIISNSSTAEPRFTDTHVIQTPGYYRQFSLSLGEAVTSHLNSTRLIRTDTPLIRTCSKVRINGICLCTGVTLNLYSQTPLIQTLRGHSESVLINRVSVLSGLNLEKMKGLGIRKTFRINELSVKRGSTVPDLAWSYLEHL